MKLDNIIFDENIPNDGTVYLVPKDIFERYAKLNSNVTIEEKEIIIDGIKRTCSILKNIVSVSEVENENKS